MNVLIVGGAGYIGSHMVKYMRRAGKGVVVLDDLSTGHWDAVKSAEFVKGSLADSAILDRVFGSHRFDAVMHFASSIEVGESVRDPGKYYRNNVANTLNLLDAMVRHGVARLVFSSSAAVFGEPWYTPIDEAHPAQPVNPYGRSKLMVENMLVDYTHAYGLRSVVLRYFNAAGADPEGELGERHDPETHLVPLVLQAASGRRPNITIYGRDYDTPDGTCVRDYVHVMDLVQAHELALDWLMQGRASTAFNLGNGEGYSIQQVIDAARQVTGRVIPTVDGAPRAGDPARLVADSARARKALKWAPQYSALATILAHAWAWEQKLAARHAARLAAERGAGHEASAGMPGTVGRLNRISGPG